jgi:hypothetical protein
LGALFQFSLHEIPSVRAKLSLARLASFQFSLHEIPLEELRGCRVR